MQGIVIAALAKSAAEVGYGYYFFDDGGNRGTGNCIGDSVLWKGNCELQRQCNVHVLCLRSRCIFVPTLGKRRAVVGEECFRNLVGKLEGERRL